MPKDNFFIGVGDGDGEGDIFGHIMTEDIFGHIMTEDILAQRGGKAYRGLNGEISAR